MTGWRKALVMGLFLWVAAGLQMALAGRVGVAGTPPDFLLATFSVLTLFGGRKTGMLLGFFSGLLQGGMAGANLTAYLATRVVAGFVLGWSKDLRLQPSLLVAAAYATVGTVLSRLFLMLIAPPAQLAPFLIGTVVAAGLSALMSLAIFPLARLALPLPKGLTRRATRCPSGTEIANATVGARLQPALNAKRARRVRYIVRISLMLVGFAGVAMAHADRLITIPAGRKLPDGTWRIEAKLGNHSVPEYRLARGLGPFFQVEFRQSAHFATVDGGYNLIAPLPGFGPGISVGLTDILDESSKGRQIYLALTFREGFETVDGEAPGEITIGARTGRRRGEMFVGANFPLLTRFALIAEHDGEELAAGVEARPTRETAVRWIFRERKTVLSVSLTRRF